MKKLISLLFIVMLLFFTNIKTVANKDIITDINIEQILQNDMVITKLDNLKVVFIEKVIPIIENKTSINFDYAYNKFITKTNDIVCISNTYDTSELKSDMVESGNTKHLLDNVKARSDRKKGSMLYATIRGPCEIKDFIIWQNILFTKIEEHEQNKIYEKSDRKII